MVVFPAPFLEEVPTRNEPHNLVRSQLAYVWESVSGPLLYFVSHTSICSLATLTVPQGFALRLLSMLLRLLLRGGGGGGAGLNFEIRKKMTYLTCVQPFDNYNRISSSTKSILESCITKLQKMDCQKKKKQKKKVTVWLMSLYWAVFTAILGPSHLDRSRILETLHMNRIIFPISTNLHYNGDCFAY